METRNTRDHLLEVGLRRIRSVGYAATGVKEILDEAQVPKGSFYHYFPSKEVFAKEVLALYVADENTRAQKILLEGKSAPLKRLRKYFEELIKVYGHTAAISGCLMGNMSLEMADHSELIQSLLKSSFGNWQAGVAEILREAIERGELSKSTKPKEFAAFLVNSYEGALLRSKAEQSNEPLENFLNVSFNILLKN
ncbi:TetR/AcrR family transcriptional regulator [Acidicapsa ligni]|uniref:TetR/AcrR family transcriptional regulator n=1 Tax=Acidicapsa ligni TaxID=542300 RepID=UPI0021E01B9A|nr:TetR/AcrR family transcriptional regulator [Acidicapsa ligni]